MAQHQDNNFYAGIPASVARNLAGARGTERGAARAAISWAKFNREFERNKFNSIASIGRGDPKPSNVVPLASRLHLGHNGRPIRESQ